MGLKRRPFVGTVKAAILRQLSRGDELSKYELVARLRREPKLESSVRKVQSALGSLLEEGAVERVGQRSSARFRRPPAM